MNVKSADSSGQFPAEVLVKPEVLRLEVTNLVGGREALIQVEGGKYTVEREGKVLKGRRSWGGIPLEWAQTVFQGRVPCPRDLNLDGKGSLRMTKTPEGELMVETINHEKFTYRFRSWAGSPWPEFVRWEATQGSQPVQVEFSFQEPDDKTGVAKIWLAKSAQGEVKVRWKDRETR